jgi:hypothetical protein
MNANVNMGGNMNMNANMNTPGVNAKISFWSLSSIYNQLSHIFFFVINGSYVSGRIKSFRN